MEAKRPKETHKTLDKGKELQELIESGKVGGRYKRKSFASGRWCFIPGSGKKT